MPIQFFKENVSHYFSLKLYTHRFDHTILGKKKVNYVMKYGNLSELGSSTRL